MTQPEALDILKTGVNVFLTGEPGSGKTYTVNRYVEYLRSHDIAPSITASTGIAATHIGGMTIHSWSGIGVRKNLSDKEVRDIAGSDRILRRIGAARVLVIDEISMLDAATLTLVDRVCRAVKGDRAPFGGLQLIVVGDFFQLPPVTRREEMEASLFGSTNRGEGEGGKFAFASSAWRAAEPVTCYLSEQHRQEDGDFLDLLSALRSGTITEAHHARLRSRKGLNKDNIPSGATKLFPHNANADEVNEAELARLSFPPRTFTMSAKGPAAVVEQLKRGCLSPEKLVLKKGARVIFTKNNFERGFVNGTIGTVGGFVKETMTPVVETNDGRRIAVEPAEWTIEDGGKKLATIAQLPLRLAWAITVHKSQGMSLDAAFMDLSASFEYGQGYVAMSRVRTLAGLHLAGYNDRALQVHPEITEADGLFRQASEQARSLLAEKTKEEVTASQRTFLHACGGSLQERKWEQSSTRVTRTGGGKERRWQRTLQLLQSGRSVAEVAQERGRTPGTILSHIEELEKLGKLEQTDRDTLARGQEDAIETIRPVLQRLGPDRLTPLYEALEGRYNYETIRLARIVLTSK